MIDDIEPKIRPLVDVLNATGLVRTFSSCEGHFSPDEQTLVDRNRADVRFVPAGGISPGEVDAFLAFVLLRFKSQHSLIPVQALGYKLYTPIDEEIVEQSFVLELRPFNRFDPPDRKRVDTDHAIGQLIRIVVAWSRLSEQRKRD